MEEKFMLLALKQAQKAYKIGEVPVGAVIVKDNVILAKAYNKKESTKSIFKHAEMIAIEKACKKNKDWRLENCTIYTTLFPCPMCASAIQQSRIKKVVYIHSSNNEYVSTNSINILTANNSNHKVEICKIEINTNLLDEFFEKIRNKHDVSRET